MKTNSLKELHGKSKEELTKTLLKLRGDIKRLTIDLATGKLRNTNEIANRKRDIAQVLTLLHQKELLKS